MQKLLENTRIVTKVMAMLLMLGVITLGIAGMNARTMWSVDADYSQLVKSELPATVQMVRMNRFATEVVQAGYRAVTFGPGSQQGRAAVQDVRTSHEAAIEGIERAATLDPALAPVAADARRQVDVIRREADQAIRLAGAGRRDEALRMLEEADGALAAFGTQMRGVNTQRIDGAAERSEALSASTSSSASWGLIISLLGIVAGVATAFWVVKAGITTPLGNLQGKMRQLASGDHSFDIPCTRRGDELGRMAEALLVFRDTAKAQEAAAAAKRKADAEQAQVVQTLGDHLDHLAKGDLTAEIQTDFPGDYEKLKVNFNAATTALRDLIAAVAESAQQIRTGSSEIAQASEDLARRTESNAASLEETSAAITQMDGRLKATAEAAGRTVERADQAISTVGGGRSIADEAVQAMGRVSDSAKGIDDVIEGLDKIAFQTRVLAMNAAVEAGRAGEAGRGFAVVADLVSALAMRAEEEAKRARDQLTVTQADIGTAVEAVQRVDGALANISSDVGEVHQLLNTMAADNHAQASAITQISAAVGSMDQSTQQNAAMVEETSAAARNLTSEVNTLADQASRFKVDRRTERRAAPKVREASSLSKIVAATVPSPGAKAAAAKPANGTYVSPVKPLPAAAVAALTRPAEDDWNEF